jgi:hypothetical protein
MGLLDCRALIPQPKAGGDAEPKKVSRSSQRAAGKKDSSCCLPPRFSCRTTGVDAADEAKRATRASQRAQSVSGEAPATSRASQRSPSVSADSFNCLHVFHSVDEAAQHLRPTLTHRPCPTVPPSLLNPRLRLLFSAFQGLIFARSALSPRTRGPLHLDLIGFVLDLFNVDVRQTGNNIRARAALCAGSTELQAQVLQLVCDALERSSLPALRVLQKARLWDVLLTDFFVAAPSQASSIVFGTFLPTPSSVELQLQQQQEQLSLQQRSQLQSVVWLLVEHAGTLDAGNNRPEVDYILSYLLHQSPPQPALIRRACEALNVLFVCNARATCAAVQDVGALGEAVSRLRFAGAGELAADAQQAFCRFMLGLALLSFANTDMRFHSAV